MSANSKPKPSRTIELTTKIDITGSMIFLLIFYVNGVSVTLCASVNATECVGITVSLSAVLFNK